MFRAPQWHSATQTHFPPRPRKSAWHCDIADVIWPRVLPTHYKQSYHTIPPIIPLTSDVPHLHQHVSRSPVARRHANALPIKAAQIRIAPRHNRRNFATRSVHTLLEACNHIAGYRQSSRSPATRRVYTSMFHAPQWHGATQTHFPPRPRKSAWHCDVANVLWPCLLPTHYKQSYHTMPPIIPLTNDTPRLDQRVSRSPQWHGATQTHSPPRPRKSGWHCDITNVIRHTVCPHTGSNHITLEAKTSESSSATLFPIVHLHCKLATSESSSERLFPALHLHYKLARSESSSPSEAPSLQNERFVRGFLRHQVSKRSVSSETSSKSETPSLQNQRFVRDFLQK